jgi:hypothetical protein
MAKKFNVIMAKRGRDRYYATCMGYLKRAAEGHDVEVYCMADETEQPFNKSRLLNGALKAMRPDFDFVSIVDIDMIYRPGFFDIIGQQRDDVYFISRGYSLPMVASMGVISCLPTMEQLHITTKSECPGRSQITLSKSLYLKLLDVLGTDKLYDERFISWGCEDSALSFLSTYCHRAGLLQRIEQNYIWYHLWHEKPKIDPVYELNNKELLKQLSLEYSVKVRDYVK